MAATAFWLSTTMSRLILHCNGKPISNATGFFLKLKDRWSLVTNWHVLSGRDPRNGQPIHSSGAVPDVCEYAIPTRTEIGIAWIPARFSLGDALLGEATWFQHSELGQDIDVGCFPIASGEVGLARDLLAEDGHDDQMWVDMGGELFLPGYPLGLTGGGGMPIWKRASLATSTEFGAGIDRYVLVDTATREGMSGAPCLAIANMQYYRRATDSPKMTIINKPLSWRLIGVYSGRIQANDSFEAQLGLVWRKELVLQTIERKTPASVLIRTQQALRV